MPCGPKLAPLAVSDGQREHLLPRTRSTFVPQGLAQRARIVLASAEGLSNIAVAQRLGLSRSKVGR